MSFKEQMASDLTAIMEADEVSEDVTYTSGLTSAVIKAVLNSEGEQSLDWSDGSAMEATAVISKLSLPSVPRPHDTLTDSNNRLWYVKNITGEDSVSWKISLYSEVKLK